ncbi:MAG: hypothetical protein A2X86_16210 [Bdellovibrionales bacterium GWA2_49_15]|nr:MAG: hypothetical protein A2X86_16210 [Bdellovibrionales bacterium GWA2_49_15]HAZ13650.1 hypothetical protein [Bdellovibrionales bacterium]
MVQLLYTRIVVVALTAVLMGNADCPTSLEMAAKLLAFARDSVTAVAPEVLPPAPRKTGERFANGNYRSRHGMIIHQNCLNKPGVTVAKLEETIGRMAVVTKRCGNRFSPYTRALFNGAFSDGPLLTCNFGAECGEGADACFTGGTRINFMSVDALLNPSTLFHEMLHQAGVDNQHVSHHNHVSIGNDDMLNDEVYFWQTVCFDPNMMLTMMRASDPTKAACSRPLQHYGRPNRVRHTSTSVNYVCGHFDRYLAKERQLITKTRTEVFPQVFTCEMLTCPDLTAIATKLRTAGKPGLILPTAATAASWTRTYGFIDEGGMDEEPWGPFNTALARQGENFTTAKLLEAGLTADEAQMYSLYVRHVGKKLKFMDEGIGSLSDYPDLALKGKSTTTVAKPIEECRTDEALRRSAICRDFIRITSPAMADLLTQF